MDESFDDTSSNYCLTDLTPVKPFSALPITVARKASGNHDGFSALAVSLNL